MEKGKPITVEEIDSLFKKSIPNVVIDAFNTLILKHYSTITKSSVVKQEEVMEIVCGDEEEKFKRSEVFNNHWLDIEDIFREAGWIVEYHKPIYIAGENYEPYFEFSRPKVIKLYGKH